MTIIRTLTHKSIKKNSLCNLCNIFSLFWDGGFDLDLTRTGIQLYGVQDTAMRGWEYFSSTSPKNINMLDANFSVQKHDKVFDFIICNDRMKQFDVAKTLAHQFHLPIIIVDHLMPDTTMSVVDTKVMKQSQASYISIGSHKLISEKWENNFTIPYGIEIPREMVQEKNNNVLIHGSFDSLAPQSRPILQQILQDTNSILKGNNKGLSEPFSSWQECEQVFNDSKVYINLSTTLSIPRGLLLAMAHGCAVVTNAVELTHTILKHEHNCLIIKNVEDIKPQTQRLLEDNKLRQKLTENAKQTIIENFPMDTFIQNWTKLINKVKGGLYLL